MRLVKARKNFATQTAVNGSSLTTLSVAAALSLGGAHAPQSQPVVTDQRLVGRAAGKIGLGAGAPLGPLPVLETARAMAGATAAATHAITWRTTPQDAAHPRIEEAGFLWTQGGPTHPEANRFRYHLQVDARTEAEALNRVRRVVNDAHGDSTDIEIVRHDPERLRRMTEAVEKTQEEEKLS